MDTELSYKTAFCTEYERLLCVCVQSRDSWRHRREETAKSGLRGKEVADELLRLQANYAKAYSRLDKHQGNCELCTFVSEIGGRHNGSISTSIMDRKHSA
jgi:hypothetical protein